MNTIPTSFVHVTALTTNAFTWFFSFFATFWGILDFVLLKPAFSIFGALATIIGVSGAWLAGTSYTNVFGQVYDFSYLYGMSFAGMHGGIVIFFVLFVVGFFIQILRCFGTMSLGPITEPLQLVWRIILGIAQLTKIMWDIVTWIIYQIIQTINALRNILPRPFGL